jgi:hypothetical protein
MLLDEEWYYVTLPGNYQIEITFQEFENINGGELMYQESGKEAFPLNQDDSFSIINNSSTESNIYFRVYADLGTFEKNKFGKYRIVVGE